MTPRKKKRQADPDAGLAEEGGSPEDAAAAEGSHDETPAEDAADGQAEEPVDEAAALRTEMEVMRDKWMRSLAEADNARRRARLDIEESRRYGASSLVMAVLGVVDNLQRALLALPEGIDEAFLEGVRMVEQQMLGVLAQHGVSPVEASRGEPLDPGAHRALLEADADGIAPGHIVDELVRGYRLHDRVLREAQVSVARAVTDGEPPASDDDGDHEG